MNNRFARLAPLFVLYLGFASPAYAYLDPATGSIILQTAIGAVGTALVYYRLGKAKIQDGVRRIFGRKSAAQDEK